MDEDKVCQRCKTSSYQNPSLILLINVCAHPICSNCVEALFIRSSGPCPVCDTVLRKKDYRGQLLESATVDKEVNIRKRILREFNRKEEDFQSLREYNDYLEMIETIIFNLSNKIDVEETQRKVEAYKKENKDNVIRNRNRKTRDEEEIEMMIELELQQKSELDTQTHEEEERRRKQKRDKEAMIDELMYSHGEAGEIVSVHQGRALEAQTPAITTAYSRATGNAMTQEQKSEPERLFCYTPLVLQHDGFPLPKPEELENSGYLAPTCVRSTTEAESTAGFTSLLCVQRALSDFFDSVFYEPPS